MSFIRRRKKEEPKPSRLLRRRKKEPAEIEEYKEFPRGGHVPDPPESCPWRKKFEETGGFWTETYFCGFMCTSELTCQAYLNYQREQRRLRKG